MSFEALENVTQLVAEATSKLNISEFMLNKYTAVSHCFYCIVGLPLNLFVTCAILYIDELNCKPRNSLLLGMLMGNILSILVATIEFINFLSPHDDLCKIQHALSGLNYVIFFLNLLLSLIDRYAAITRPLWHRDKVTVRFVVLWQIGLSLFFSVLVKGVFIFQIEPLTCDINMTEVNIYSAITPTLFGSCIVIRIVLYFKTKQLLHQRRRNIVDPPGSAAAATTTTTALVTGSLSLAVTTTPPILVVRSGATTETTTAAMSVHMSGDSIDQLEEEATRTLAYSLTTLLLLFAPAFIYLAFILVYTQFYPIEQCQSVLNWSPFIEELANFHGIAQPMAYLYWSREFWSACKKWIERRSRQIPVAV